MGCLGGADGDLQFSDDDLGQLSDGFTGIAIGGSGDVAIDPVTVEEGEIPTITGTGIAGDMVTLVIDGGDPVTVVVGAGVVVVVVVVGVVVVVVGGVVGVVVGVVVVVVVGVVVVVVLGVVVVVVVVVVVLVVVVSNATTWANEA